MKLFLEITLDEHIWQDHFDSTVETLLNKSGILDSLAPGVKVELSRKEFTEEDETIIAQQRAEILNEFLEHEGIKCFIMYEGLAGDRIKRTQIKKFTEIDVYLGVHIATTEDEDNVVASHFLSDDDIIVSVPEDTDSLTFVELLEMCRDANREVIIR
jgi:hypothetical protein